MEISNYMEYTTTETMMGPNCVRILKELFDKYPLKLTPDDLVLDLGCGKGVSSLVIAKETGAKVYAYDLWVSQKENAKRFSEWGISEQVIPICGDANNLHIYSDEKQFSALISIDSYHYFGSKLSFFQQRILPFMKDDSAALIGVPGVREEYSDRCEELLSDWLGTDIYMFKSPKVWKELIGEHERIESVIIFEMECFEKAWKDWITSGNEHANEDLRYYETIIKPYTFFVGIYVKIK